MANWFGNNSDALLSAGLGLLSGRNSQEQMAGGLGGFVQARKDGRQKNATMEWLQKNSPDLLPMLDAGMSPADLLTMAYKQKLETAKAQRPDYMAVGKRVFDKTTGQFINLPGGEAAAADDDEWGLNPVWGTDANGRTVIGQTSKSGKFKPLDTGDFTPTPGLNNIDTGTSIITRNSRTGATMSETPKNLADAEREKAIGKGEGDAMAEANTALPSARAMAADISKQVQSLKEDPYLDSMLGSIDSRLPNLTSDAARVQSKINQLSGGAFLQGRQMLKGGGAITDFESKKAEQAFIRLEQAQDPADFREALDEFNYWVQAGVTKLEQQAGGSGRAAGGSDARGAQRTATGTSWRMK
jgi:hypothetical protein